MPDQRKEGKLLHNFFVKAKEHRSSVLKLDEKWRENLEYLKGEQKLGGDGDRSDTVTNFMFAQIMTMVPILSNRMPDIAVTPIRAEHEAHAKLLAFLINRIIKANDFITRQAELVTNGLLFGRGYMKPVWDRRMRGGIGDVRIEVADTRTIYKEPGKPYVRDANALFEERYIDKLSLYQMYPKQKDLIDKIFRKGDQSPPVPPPEEGGNTGVIEHHAAAHGQAELTTSEAYVWDMLSKSERDKNKVSIVEAWFIDDTVVEDYIRVNQPGKRSYRKKGLRKKYPRGRLVTMSGDVILDSRPNPFPEFPYIEFNNYYIPGEEYGQGELEQLKELQEQYNLRMNQIFDGVNFTTFPMIFYDHSAQLDPEEIENKPGGMYPVADVNGIKRFDPTGIHQAVFDSLPVLERNIETISGVREIQQGTVPGDVRSGFAIEQLQESAQNRLRMKTRNLEAAHKKLAKNLTDLIGLFYKRDVHYIDAGGLDISGIQSGDFEYEVKAGINLPVSRMAEQQRYQWMFANGMVDELFMIEVSDIPNKEELIARMKPIWDMKRSMLLGQVPSPGAPGQLGVVGGG